MGSRVVLAIAVLACVATSPKRWHLSATPGAGMPVSSPADGSSGVLLTVESSGAPEVKCEFANGQSTRYLPLQGGTYLCPPGGKLKSIELTGRMKMGLCSGDDGPPKGEHVRVVKTELVPVWRATVEEVFDATSEESIAFNVESPHVSFVEAFIDGTDVTDGILVSSYTDNFHRVDLEGGLGSERRHATIRVRATVFGICEKDKDCAKPADEPLKIVRSR